MTTDIESKGCIIFHLAADDATVSRIKSRLATDYSPPAYAEGAWFLATNPIYLAEFAGVISYMRRLEKAFATEASSGVRITPGCLSRRNLIWGAPQSDARAIFLADNAYAVLGGVARNDGSFSQEPCEPAFALPTELIAAADAILGSTMRPR